jgi:Family of unknown function (DUF6212)
VPKITITHRAFGLFYRATTAVLVGQSISGRVAEFLPEGVAVFHLSKDGLIDLFPTGAVTAHNSANDLAPIPLVGMASGLVAVLVGTACAESADALVAHCGKQGMWRIPPVHIMPRFGRSAVSSAISFLAAALAENLKIEYQQLATAQHQMAALRVRHERLWLNFEKARRMIQGVGYGLSAVSYSLEPGEKSVGPSSALPGAPYEFFQILPTDLSGFVGISLFVAEEPTSTDGNLTVSIRRRADGALIGGQTVPYCDIEAGWFNLGFEHAMPVTVGDCVLEISWQGEGGPNLALADVCANRFGDAAGRSLAVQIIKGLADPSRENTEGEALAQPHLWQEYFGHNLIDFGSFLGGPKAEKTASEKLGNQVISSNGDEGWLQTHMLAEVVSGWRMPALLTPGSTNLRVSCLSDHENTPPGLYMVMALPTNISDAVALKLFSEIGQGTDQPLVGNDAERGIYWSAAVVLPKCETRLELEFGKPLNTALDVILAVKPVMGIADYGHARWLKLGIGRGYSALALPASEAGEGEAPYGQAGHQCWQIRTHRLSEIASQISFYQGRAKLAALTSDLGFSPMMISEDTGALQTHPFNGEASVGVLHRGVPVGAQRISAEIGTAHETAPRFTYILGVVPSDAAGKEALISDMIARVRGGEILGHDPASGMCWSARTMQAMSVKTLALEFAEGPKQAGDVVFAVFAAEGSDSYGWCRWYSYDVEIAAEAAFQYRLEGQKSQLAGAD